MTAAAVVVGIGDSDGSGGGGVGAATAEGVPKPPPPQPPSSPPLQSPPGEKVEGGAGAEGNVFVAVGGGNMVDPGVAAAAASAAAAAAAAARLAGETSEKREEVAPPERVRRTGPMPRATPSISVTQRYDVSYLIVRMWYLVVAKAGWLVLCVFCVRASVCGCFFLVLCCACLLVCLCVYLCFWRVLSFVPCVLVCSRLNVAFSVVVLCKGRMLLSIVGRDSHCIVSIC